MGTKRKFTLPPDPPKPVLLVDLDNTLIDTSPLYHFARMAWSRLMHLQGFVPDDAPRRFQEYDTTRMAEVGVAVDRFPKSMVGVYTALCLDACRIPDPVVSDWCERIGEGVFTAYAPKYPGVDAALNLLAWSYTLHLYTQGDSQVQARRIWNVGLNVHFPPERTHIVARKDEAALIGLLAQLETTPDRAIAVGDSLYGDVAPALAVGLHRVVWVDGNHWEPGQRPDHPSFRSCAHFRDVPALLALPEEA